MATDTALLSLENVTLGYGGSPIVRGVNMRARLGELTAVVGPNGAGKSTLMKGIMGIRPIDSGHVRLNDEEITSEPLEQRIRRGIAYVPQLANVFPSLTVRENLELGCYIRRGDVNARIKALCEMFPDLTRALRRQARTLSGGQRMMLALARGLMLEPQLLLLDEPTAGLAPRVVDSVWEQILAIKATGVGVLMVEQNTRRSLAAADWAYVLTDGQNHLEGPGPELLANDDLVRLYIGGATERDGQPLPDRTGRSGVQGGRSVQR